jgi:hypothetical protein
LRGEHDVDVGPLRAKGGRHEAGLERGQIAGAAEEAKGHHVKKSRISPRRAGCPGLVCGVDGLIWSGLDSIPFF